MNSNEINTKVEMSLSSTHPSWGRKPCLAVLNVDVHINDNPNDLFSLSHHEENVVSSNENRNSTQNKRTMDTDLPKNYRNGIPQSNNQLTSFDGRNNVDKAQQFLSESGILGSTSSISLSRDLITKTSRIHLDPTVQNQIRKTSLGLRSKRLGEHFAATIASQKYIPHATITTSASQNIRLQNIWIQVHNLKDTIETETIKFLMLRAEVSKIKRTLQDLIYANSINETNLCLENSSLCVFCQQDYSLNSSSLRLHFS